MVAQVESQPDNAPPTTAEDVLTFWLGTAPRTSDELKAHMKRWFGGSTDLDTEIAARFAPAMAAAAAGELADWAAQPRGRLALIVLLDQFPRSVYRGEARAFDQDARALELTLTGIDAGMDRDLGPLERLFFYMPLQHAESREIQERSVETFEAFSKVEVEPLLRGALSGVADYARQHRDIIAAFGRFPHRNAVLGRRNTAEEQSYLDHGAPTFGQQSPKTG